jgi:uncharacterized Zn finger protein (UPF0148 family)
MSARFCVNCGTKLEEGVKFCSECGVEISSEESVQQENTYKEKVYREDSSIKKNQNEIYQDKLEFTGNKYEKIFVEPDENYVDALGDGYLVKFLSIKKIKRVVALLSDKRIYLRGNMIDIDSGKIKRTNVQKTIDLEDITGTGFSFESQVWKLIVGILFAVVAIFVAIITIDRYDYVFDYNGGASVFFFVLNKVLSSAIVPTILAVGMIVWYIMSRHTFFMIEYAGGYIKFNSSFYGVEKSRNFEKEIRLAKNKVKERILQEIKNNQ